jgi:hypothetical protein
MNETGHARMSTAPQTVGSVNAAGGDSQGGCQPFRGADAGADPRSLFSDIRAKLFPQWDRQKLWRCKVTALLPMDGMCNWKHKVILIARASLPLVEMEALIIHEICHSSAAGHGNRWSRRMLQAGRRAERIGRIDLAKVILSEVSSHEGGLKIWAPQVYEWIAQAVLESGGTVSLPAALQWVAKDLGIPWREVLRRYRRSQAVFSKAMDEVHTSKHSTGGPARSAVIGGGRIE